MGNNLMASSLTDIYQRAKAEEAAAQAHAHSASPKGQLGRLRQILEEAGFEVSYKVYYQAPDSKSLAGFTSIDITASPEARWNKWDKKNRGDITFSMQVSRDGLSRDFTIVPEKNAFQDSLASTGLRMLFDGVAAVVNAVTGFEVKRPRPAFVISCDTGFQEFLVGSDRRLRKAAEFVAAKLGQAARVMPARDRGEPPLLAITDESLAARFDAVLKSSAKFEASAKRLSDSLDHAATHSAGTGPARSSSIPNHLKGSIL
jgi:hypothetical protein